MTQPYVDWNTPSLVRRWWYCYYQVLVGPLFGNRFEKELWSITDELESRGIVGKWQSMPRKGAEDLADLCDRKRKK